MSNDDFHGCKMALFIGSQLVCLLRDDKPDLPFANMWDFPGGGREGAETPEETVARELQEELGLDFSDVEVIWQLREPAAHTPGAMVHFFVGRLPEGAEAQIYFGDEGQGWELFSVERVLAGDRFVPSLPPRLWRFIDLQRSGKLSVAPPYKIKGDTYG